MHGHQLVYLQIRQKINCCKNLHQYIEISKKKESSANFSGDGPIISQNFLKIDELQNLRLLAIQLNGMTIYRLRKNCPFKVDAIDPIRFPLRTVNSTEFEPIRPYQIGDVVTKINEIDLTQYDNLSAARLLASTKIISIIIMSPIEYTNLRKQLRISTNIKKNITTDSTNVLKNIAKITSAQHIEVSSSNDINNTVYSTSTILPENLLPIISNINPYSTSRSAISFSETNSIRNQLNLTTSDISQSDITPLRRNLNSNINSELILSTSTVNYISGPDASPENSNLNSTISFSETNSIRTQLTLTTTTVNDFSESDITPLRRNLTSNTNSELILSTSTVNYISGPDATPERRNLNNELINSYDIRPITVEWDYENQCLYCGFIYLKTEKNRKNCCSSGQFLGINSPFPKLNPLPPQIRFLCIERTPHFSRNSVSYNNILALGATGVDNGTDSHGWEYRFENSCITLHGRTYHFLNSSAGKGGFQYFLYDAQAAMIKHGNELNNNQVRQDNLRIYSSFLQQIYIELKNINILVSEVEKIGNEISTNVHLLGDTNNFILDLNATTSHFDVAAISSTESSGNRVLKIRRKGNQITSNIQLTDSKLEPLSYPLLFPYGENGWGENIRKLLKFPTYLLSRMLMGEKNEDGTPLQVKNRKGNLVTVNRFQLMSRLGQTYLVDNVSRAIDYRLQWFKKHQEDVFGVLPKSSLETSQENSDDHNDENNNEVTFLGQSFHGSRRHLRSLSVNALSIISEYGRPSVFITLTCNAYWDEITEMLLESQVFFLTFYISLN
jgi:hypothetical protein